MRDKESRLTRLRSPLFCTFLLLTALGGPHVAPGGGGGKEWPGVAVIRKVLKKSGRRRDFTAFIGDYNRLIGTQVQRYRLDEVARIQQNPLEFPERAYALTEGIHDSLAAGLETPGRSLEPMGRLLGVRGKSEEPERLRRGLDGRGHLDQLQEVLEGAGREVRRGWGALTGEERAFLAGQAVPLTDQFLAHIYLENNGSNYEANRKAIDLGEKIDLEGFIAAAEGISRLGDPRFLGGFRRDVKGLRPLEEDLPSGVKGKVLLHRETPLGTIIVGGPGKNEYDLPAAIILDVGGDDTYTGTVGMSSFAAKMPVSLVVDLEGNDRYRTDGDGIGLGLLGVGMVIDLAGNDTYEAGRRSLGCGLFGVGVLLDGEGDDTYLGTEYTQGAGAFGIGALVDHAGDDRFKADLYAQGFGLPRGCGVLWDGEGDDTYTCTGTHPSGYGDEGEFNGMGQGIGMGFRGMQRGGLGAGGIGALLDGGGDDKYRAGQFGLGCGYYFGMGIVRDRGGNDDYEASRYGLATGAHYALGIVIDDKGNDKYVGRGVANQAGNWDLTISYLIDGGGDDSYKAPGLSQGSATITSLAVLADASGSDIYESTGSDVQGHGGHGTDGKRKTKSFGFLLDFGKGKDTYTFKKGKDSQPRTQNSSNLKVHFHKDGKTELGLGFFVDSPKSFR